MAGRPYVLAEVTWKTVKETKYEVAVLPWGATEAHNYHLPYGTDNIQCDYIGAESARIAWEKGARVIVLPTVPFGVNTGQLDIPLDINMNPSTQAAVLGDVVDAVSGQDIYKLVILNGHGGNDFKQMIRELQAQYPETFLCSINWWQTIDAKRHFHEPGDHGGEMETSNMMVIAPDLVLPLSEAGNGYARSFKLRGLKDRWVWAQRNWTSVTNDTGVGDPSRATLEKGQNYLEETTALIGGFLADLAQADLNDIYEK